MTKPMFNAESVVWSKELKQNVKFGWHASAGKAFVWFLPPGTGGCWRPMDDLEPAHNDEKV